MSDNSNARAREVTLLRWPDDADTRMSLAKHGMPRLLLLGADVMPPERIDDLEDWVQAPYSPAELAARTASLQERADMADRLAVVDDCLLHFRGRWVPLTVQQAPVVRLLVERVGHLVTLEQIADVYAMAGGTPSSESIRALVTRIRHRLSKVGLRLRAIRERGVVLELPGR
jgi:DNA-binding response OmpR family regulator